MCPALDWEVIVSLTHLVIACLNYRINKIAIPVYPRLQSAIMEGPRRNFGITIVMIMFLCSLCAGDIDYVLEEELPANTIIGEIARDSGLSEQYSASDMDKIRYSFLSPDEDQAVYFILEEDSGILKTSSKLDRDSICEYEDICLLTVSIAISPAQFFRVFTLNVRLLDLNDNSPSFGQSSIYLRLPESSRPGKVLALPQAVDPDTSAFTIKSYSLVTREDIPFLLERSIALDGSTELKLVLQSHIDREVTAFYHFEIIAEDGGNPPRSGALEVNITVEDTNDHVPVFERQSYEIEVEENAHVGTTVLTVIAYDVDIGLNGQILFALAPRTDERYGHLFGVRETSGELYIKDELDFEAEPMYHLVITATDRGPDAQTSQTTVTVHIMDINDYVPVITVNTLTSGPEAQVLENVPEGTFVSHLRVVDRDSGEGGEVICGLDSDDFELSPLETAQYTIVTKTIFDRESKNQYMIHLRCQDKGEPPLSSGYNLTVLITDANDHPPEFTKSLYAANIDENTPAPEIVLRVEATDEDIGENARVEFFLSERNIPEVFSAFEMEPATGVLHTKIPLDHELNSSIVFDIVARDHGDPVRTATAQISLSVLDFNDCKPNFTQNGYSFGLYENKLPGTNVGNVAATDQDSEPYNSILFSLQMIDSYDYNISNKFRIDSQTGRIYTRVELDREVEDKYLLTLIASNPGYPGMSSSATVTIYIADENDNSPVFEFPSPTNNTVYAATTAQMGDVITRVRAHDLDMGDNARVSFDLLDGAADTFELDKSNGAVTVNADLSELIDTEFNLTIEASDFGTPPRRQSAVLVVFVTDANAPWEPHTKSKNNGSSEMPNFGIVIGVACGSIIVIALLAIAIIVISCQGMKHQARKSSAQYQGQYNCRTTEAQRMLHGRPDNRSPSESGSSQLNSPVKMGDIPPNHKTGPEDVQIVINDNLRNESLSGSTQAMHLDHSKAAWRGSNDLQAKDGLNSLPRLHQQIATPHKVPLSICDGCVKSSPQESHHDKFATTLVPLTDKEIEIHKVLKFLHSQQDDAESGCSETMSTSDSGRGNSVSEDTLDHPNHRAPSAPYKQVHFMPIVTQSGGSQSRLNGVTSPALRGSNTQLNSSHPPQQHRQNLSTFSSPNTKTLGHVSNPKRQPARVSFQCPPYDTLPSSQHKGGVNNKRYGSDTHNQVPMYKIDECLSSTENLSDDTASTMSGSYVIQHEDHPHVRGTHSPTILSPAVCRVLPTIQDSVV